MCLMVWKIRYILFQVTVIFLNIFLNIFILDSRHTLHDSLHTHTRTDSESVSYHNTASFFSGMVAKWLVKFFNLMAYLQWRDAHYSSIVKTELWILQKADAYIPKCCSSLSDQFFQFTSSQLKRSELFVGKTKLTFSNAVGDTMLLLASPLCSAQHFISQNQIQPSWMRVHWSLKGNSVLSFSQGVQRSEWLQLLKSLCFAQGPYSRIDECRQADLEPEHLS